MAIIRIVECWKTDAQGNRVPQLDAEGNPVLVTRGPHKGKPAYAKEKYRDAQGRFRWRAWVYDVSACKSVTRTFKKRNAAEQWVRAMEQQKAEGVALAPRAETRTVYEYIRWWLAAKSNGAIGRRISSRTARDYETMIKRWIDISSLASLPMCRVQEYDIKHFIRDVRATTTEDYTRRLVMMLRQFFAYAMKAKVLAINPCARISIPTPPKRILAPIIPSSFRRAWQWRSPTRPRLSALRYAHHAHFLRELGDRYFRRVLPQLLRDDVVALNVRCDDLRLAGDCRYVLGCLLVHRERRKGVYVHSATDNHAAPNLSFSWKESSVAFIKGKIYQVTHDRLRAFHALNFDTLRLPEE